ncbi:lytic murein transglycosylase [Oricola cellulosilytica]|uniref:Lytic murein transglycosylase n=1 Tax=Oricola cellulosilytica TaxID=1429082 RepID=A0A4R0PDW3_9HYPH|nr:lytic murein transglycosylase [Oricola cellulosilytica]TCD15975.1 lytic murein transglycosylase [Oricola cellulosilytica]
MKFGITKRLLGTAAALALLGGSAAAAQCGNDAGGFEIWKQQFAQEARSRGIGQRGLQALAGAQYATKTIAADRNQKTFRYSLDKFMKVRGADTIVAQGRKQKVANAQLFAALEQRYGVPPGPLIAIHGMETGFGRFMGDANVLSAIATLAYDCRRSAFFTTHLYAALQLIDRGVLSSTTRGAMHGEVGHTQFLPANVMQYGVDGDGNGRLDLTSKADALASTANFLRAHGWRAGAGYQPGQSNFRAIQGWNAASVYQQAIAIIAARIDG